jgi:hypothetical protein
VGQFDCGTRILRVIHGQDARATFETDPPLASQPCFGEYKLFMRISIVNYRSQSEANMTSKRSAVNADESQAAGQIHAAN